MRIHVTFRNKADNLTCMFSETFSTIKAAKLAIKQDAAYFLKHHNINPTGVKQSAKWINPKSEDYYHVIAKDGESCIWQYFAFPY